MTFQKTRQHTDHRPALTVVPSKKLTAMFFGRKPKSYCHAGLGRCSSLMAKGELWNDSTRRAIELVLSSRSLRYARAVFTMGDKGSTVPESDRSQFQTICFQQIMQKRLFK
jgi:hypothetical protein